jgi:hypothetical protein
MAEDEHAHRWEERGWQHGRAFQWRCTVCRAVRLDPDAFADDGGIP